MVLGTDEAERDEVADEARELLRSLAHSPFASPALRCAIAKVFEHSSRRLTAEKSATPPTPKVLTPPATAPGMADMKGFEGDGEGERRSCWWQETTLSSRVPAVLTAGAQGRPEGSAMAAYALSVSEIGGRSAFRSATQRYRRACGRIEEEAEG